MTPSQLVQAWVGLSEWLFPVLWLLLGVYGMARRLRLAGLMLIVAGAAALLFTVLFGPDSAFTAGWATDSPVHVAFDYKPLGFMAANGLPALSNIALLAALLSLLRRPA